MKYFSFILIFFTISCAERGQIDQFRTGTFKTFSDVSEVTTVAERTADIQIETHGSKKYTYDIKWNSNFEYTLRNKYPKNGLDSTLFIVKITGFKKNSYTFEAHFKGSKHIQKGWVEKLD